VLTRDAPDDHPWHHGLWFTIKYVNEENFWEEQPPYGVLRHRDEHNVEWIRPDRETVVIDETCHLTHVDLADDAYAIDITIRITPRVDVVLDTTPFTTWGGYGGLTLRGNRNWQNTRILLSDGSTHDRPKGVPALWADPDKIDQVLSNLIENAVRHGDGTVTIDITATASPREGEGHEKAATSVTVSDEGPGIPEESMNRVFTRFWRGSKRGGTGLGLYIVKGIVEAHGGTITVGRAPQGGAEFRFTLPVAAPAYLA